MDAKTFISKKHHAAVDELKAIDAEYIPKRDAALAAIAITEKWLDELSSDKQATVPEVVMDANKNGVSAWVSNRDLTPQGRQN